MILLIIKFSVGSCNPRKANRIEEDETLRLNESDIKRATNTKSLGIIVDEGLNWERQYKTAHNKIRGGLQSLRRLKSILSQSSLSNAYLALVESHVRYADVIWGSLLDTKIESLQRLQDRAVSMIHTPRIKDNWTPKFYHMNSLLHLIAPLWFIKSLISCVQKIHGASSI